jgi:hypothetical protein
MYMRDWLAAVEIDCLVAIKATQKKLEGKQK